jgi:sulfate/thiosulfate transport system permease protein
MSASWPKCALRLTALGYLGLQLALPVALVFWRTFGDGVGAVIESITTPEDQHAFFLTVAWW